MTELAPAKLNLALHVTGQRADGYHLLDSLVCFARVGDEVTLQPGPLSLTIKGPFAAGLAADDDNLCLRAARIAGAEARLTLIKNLPVAAGIGGGSADAAAVLRGLARMGYPLPPALDRLGADVPVCLASRPARMRGVGETLDPVPPVPVLSLVLVNPGIALPTPQVFAGLDRRDNPGMPDMPHWPDRNRLIDWLHQTRNDLEPPAIAAAPVIAEVLSALQFLGAAFQRMSGSGATCFGIFARPDLAHDAAAALARKGWWAVATELAPDQWPG
ncbi:MAG: 4-(cytidine 5'-diphospho)-2-C-methyl-D-erythritol kinase [Paracoccus sp. (in: a-proteobacteria)]|nr:4-(cytidine 5'-diphospho)-2-C-methyl-D-erythritol kinase [Paracoccus sp. (in: a-proteobacteria)]